MYSVQKENQDPRSTHHHCPNSIDPDSVVCAVTIFTQDLQRIVLYQGLNIEINK